MKTNVIIAGGLGNQMFQYALLLSLRAKGHQVCADTSFYRFVKMHNGYELGRVFGVSEPVKSKGGIHLLWLRMLDKYSPDWLCSKDYLRFDHEILEHPQKYIRGYWQSELYFSDVKEDVRKSFHFKNIDDFNMKIAQEMSCQNSVSIHIRRGDYAAYGMTIIGKEFYKKAVSIICKKIEAPKFYVFSDDEEEARIIVEESRVEYQFINHNIGTDSYKDMYLMSQCKHNIIANSSFSWWGAWLNDNQEQIVVTPKWLNDFNLKKWIEI